MSDIRKLPSPSIPEEPAGLIADPTTTSFPISRSGLPRGGNHRQDNPFDTPRFLLEIMSGPVPDALGIVLTYLDALPEPIQTLCATYSCLDPASIEDLRAIHRAITKLGQDTLPTREELNLLISPGSLLCAMKEGLSEIAAFDVDDPALIAHLGEIADRLEETEAVLSKPELEWALRIWADYTADNHGLPLGPGEEKGPWSSWEES